MEVLISDPGARGHALARKIAESSLVDQVFVAPGNPGTEEVAESTGIAHTDIDAQLDFVRKQKQIGLVVVSADEPLAAGAVDVFESEFSDRGLKVWGPSKAAAQIEWSKVYAKQLMQSRDIPTSKFGVMNNFNRALYYADCQEYPLFVKIDKLFGGKGVERCDDGSEVESVLRRFRQLGHFDAKNPVLLEAESKGPELSLQAFCDGTDYVMVPFAMRDHKTIFEYDRGPMTGGMGVVGPVPGITPDDINHLGEIFVAPVLAELKRQGRPFKGMLYPGLKGRQCLEYNARPGDPETQLWATLLQSDLVEIMLASCEGALSKLPVPLWRNAASVCIVLAAKGYPGKPEKGAEIIGLDQEFPGNTHILHAGTKCDKNKTTVNGGRVLNIVTAGEEGEALESLLSTAYQAADCVNFDGKQLRRDVGEEVLSPEFQTYVETSRPSWQ